MSDLPDIQRKGQGGPVAGLGQAYSRFQDIMAEPGVRRAMPMIMATILVVAGLIFYAFMQAPTYTTLYGSLPEAEKAKVVEALKNAGIPVNLDPATGDVTVPADQYHSARLNLAAQGLPESVPDGYNVLGDMPMGTSRSVESMRLKQSQEVELAKSINSIETVQNSRVHLAIPERSAFARNSQPPTASVFVQLAPGRTLATQQIAAIVNLVSSAVPNMPKTSVSVVDQNGRLLSDATNDPTAALTEKQLQHQMSLETILRNRVISLLTPVAGLGNVSAQVSLSMDFTRIESTEDSLEPRSQVIVSERLVDEKQSRQPAVGVPGAVANEPPATADLVEQESQAVELTPRSGDDTVIKSMDSTKNYEYSRRLQRQESAFGTIKRLHVAVLLRENPPEDPAVLEDPKYIEKHQKDIAELEQLVMSAIGFTPERGDSITIAVRPFNTKLQDGVEPVWYEVSWIQDVFQGLITVLAIGVIVLGVIRPMLAKAFATDVAAAAATAVETAELEAEGGLDTIQVEPGQSLEEIKAKLKPKKQGISAEMLDTANSYEDKVALIRMIVTDEAGRVANVFKAMMARELNR